jgi:hypothetical protein
VELLRQLYISAGIPISQNPTSREYQSAQSLRPIQQQIHQPTQNTATMSQSQPPKATTKKQPTPPIARPQQSRQDYLARLAKAKAKSRSKSPAPQLSSEKNQATPAPTQDAVTSQTKAAISAGEQSSLNMEIRRRLELLKHKKSPSSGSSQQQANQPTGQNTPSSIEYGPTRGSQSPGKTAQAGLTNSTVTTSTVPKPDHVGHSINDSQQSQAIRPPLQSAEAGVSKTNAPPSQIPGLFMGNGFSEPTQSESVTVNPSQRLNSNQNTQRQAPRLAPEESVIIDLSSDDEADGSDMEEGEVRSPKPAPVPPQPSRPKVSSRVNSINSSGTQTPKSTVLQLRHAEIERAKAKLLEEIAKKEQNRKMKVDNPQPVTPQARRAPPVQIKPVEDSPRQESLSAKPQSQQVVRPPSQSIPTPVRPDVRQSSLVADEKGNKSSSSKKAKKLAIYAQLEEMRRQMALLEAAAREHSPEPKESSEPGQSSESARPEDVIITHEIANPTDHVPDSEIIAVPEKAKSTITVSTGTIQDSKSSDDMHLSDNSSDQEEGELSDGDSTSENLSSTAETLDTSANVAGAPAQPTPEDESDDLYSADKSMAQPQIAQQSDTTKPINSTAPSHDTAEPQNSELLAEQHAEAVIAPNAETVDDQTDTNHTALQNPLDEESSDSEDEVDMDEYEPDLELPQFSPPVIDTPPILIADDLAPELQLQPSPFASSTAVVCYLGS